MASLVIEPSDEIVEQANPIVNSSLRLVVPAPMSAADNSASPRSATFVAKSKAELDIEKEMFEIKKQLASMKMATARTTKVEEEMCPKGALRIPPGLNSLKDAIQEAKEKGIKDIYLLNGTHDEERKLVNIDHSVSIIGESREHCIVLGGLKMNGKKKHDINVSNLTLRESKGNGVSGDKGASIHLDNVSVEYSGWNGVSVFGTKRNSMKNCNVSHSKHNGLLVQFGGVMWIDGNATTVHHNASGYPSGYYGLCAHVNSSIHLASSLTIEMITKNNCGGGYGNFGGKGTIKTITSVDVRTKNTEYKTSLCTHYIKSGKCQFGSNCIFAHGKDKLKTSVPKKNTKQSPKKQQQQQQQPTFGLISAWSQQQQEQQQSKSSDYSTNADQPQHHTLPSYSPLKSTTAKVNVKVTVCPEGALRVAPGLNSLMNAVYEAHTNGITDIFLLNGTHDEKGNIVNINIPISIIGESREHCVVMGGLYMYENREDDVNVSNLTLRDSMGNGVCGNWNGATIHLDNVSVENSGQNGVEVHGRERNTMKNCNVSHSKQSGLVVQFGVMTIEGNATTIHHNCTDGYSGNYGLDTGNNNSSGSIHLASSLTIEAISKNNGGGRNYGGRGTFKTITNTQSTVETEEETVPPTLPRVKRVTTPPETPPPQPFMPATKTIKPTGIIKFYDPKRNYGICTLQDGREVFVLSTSLPVNYIPVENDTIEFDLEIQVRSSGSEKLHARNIAFLSMSQLIERLSSSSSSSIAFSATTKINTSPLKTTMANNQSQVMQFDLEERLNQSLHHLQTQQTQLLESRAAHSDVLTKMSNFENEVILLRSREKEIMNQRDRALEDCQHQELRAKIAEEETDKVIAWTSRAETTADAFSVMQASNTTRSLQLKSIPTVPANQSKSNYQDDSNNNDNSKTTTDDNLVIPPINTDVAEYAKIRRKAWINWLQENNLSEIGNDPNRHTRATLFRFRQSDKQEINFQKERYRIIRKKKYNTPEVTLKSHRVQRELKVQETIQNKLSWNHATSEFQMTDINGKKRYADLYNSETGILIEVEDFDTWPNAIGQLRRYQTILEREGKSVNKMILVVFNCGDQDTKDMKQVCKKFDIVARCWWSFLAQASFITMSNFLCVKLDRNTRSSNSKRDTDYSIPPLPDTKSLSHNEKDT